MTQPSLLLRELGTVEYSPTLQLMKDFTDARSSDTPDELWLLQHPRVFTQGQAGKAEHVLAPLPLPTTCGSTAWFVRICKSIHTCTKRLFEFVRVYFSMHSSPWAYGRECETMLLLVETKV